MSFPKIKPLSPPDENVDGRVLLISEGFERRSLWFSESLSTECEFADVVIFVNKPGRASKLKELAEILEQHTSNPIKIVEFDRASPELAERDFKNFLESLKSDCRDFVVDISVFSRLLIMMVFKQLARISCPVKIVYSEPKNYSPTEIEFKEWLPKREAEMGAFATAGLKGVLRTVDLSSTVMTGAPVVLIAFASFNAYLISGLLQSVSPSRLIVIGANPPRLQWRRLATSQIHTQIITEYRRDNECDDEGALRRESSTLDYRETLRLLSELYQEFCFTHRIVLAPTGSKMQALGCAFFRAICNDVHVEYPMPERFFHKGFSSDESHEIHEICFEDFSSDIQSMESDLGLDGSW